MTFCSERKLSQAILLVKLFVYLLISTFATIAEANLTEKTKLLIQLTTEADEDFNEIEFCELISKTKLIKGNVQNIGLFDGLVCVKNDLGKITADTLVLKFNISDSGYTVSYTIAGHTEYFEVNESNIKSLLTDENYISDLAFYLLVTMPFHGYLDSDNGKEKLYVGHNKQKFKLQWVRLVWLPEDQIYYVTTDPHSKDGVLTAVISYELNEKILHYYSKKLSNGIRYIGYEPFLDSHSVKESRYSAGVNFYRSIVAKGSVLSKASFVEADFGVSLYKSINAKARTRIWPKIKDQTDRFGIKYYDLIFSHILNYKSAFLIYGLLYQYQVNDIRISSTSTDKNVSDFKNLQVNSPGYRLSLKYLLDSFSISIGIESYFESDNIESKIFTANLDTLLKSDNDFSLLLQGSFYYEQKKIEDINDKILYKLSFAHLYAGLGLVFLF